MELKGTECHFEGGCTLELLSCRYLSYLVDYELDFYENYDKALAETKRGKSWGILYFDESYSTSLLTRIGFPQGLDHKTINNSEIHVHMDMSNSQIGLINSRDLQEAYHKFMVNYLEDCGSKGKLGDIPVNFGEPIYGKMNPTFTDFVAPGVIVT
jgi:huntingtin